MFQRIYIHNYKCLQDFEWNLNDEKSLLLLGKNGTGKSSILSVLELLRDLALGKDIFEIDLPSHQEYEDVVLKFDVSIKDKIYKYEIVISENNDLYEKLIIDNQQIFERYSVDELSFHGKNFLVNVDQSVLYLLSTKSDDIFGLVDWICKMILIAPNPSIMYNNLEYIDSKKRHLLKRKAENLTMWLYWLHENTSISNHINSIFNKIVPDFQSFEFLEFRNLRHLSFIFKENEQKIMIPFDDLSDGERIIFLFSIILALMSHDEEPIFVFWDEPENYISLALLQSLIQFMRSKAEFSQQSHQVFFSSHNSEVINAFSSSHIYYLYRDTHITPTRICNVAEKGIENIIDELKYGELS